MIHTDGEGCGGNGGSSGDFKNNKEGHDDAKIVVVFIGDDAASGDDAAAVSFDAADDAGKDVKVSVASAAIADLKVKVEKN
ncbi:MAG: hypothetical protein QWI73_05255 [Alphaproteobacteria bacterium]|nr:hypothetical protein [Alphaproteobacteria bacterium]